MTKHFLKFSCVLALGLLFLTSCNEESSLPGVQNQEGTATSSSATRSLASKGQADSTEVGDLFCFTINYPIEVALPGGAKVSVASDEALYQAVSDYYEQNPESEEDPSVVFPIVVTKADGDQATIVDDQQLYDLFEACWEVDDDYDGEVEGDSLCFVFDYPITVVFEDGATQVVSNEEELDQVTEISFTQDREFDFKYPLTVRMADGTSRTIADAEALEELIEECYGGHDMEGEWGEDEACFSLQFPITVVFEDGSTQSVASESALAILDSTSYEQERPYALQFPITVTMADGTTRALADEAAFDQLMIDCYGDMDCDGDFAAYEECFDLVFPVQVKLPDGSQQAASDEEALDRIFSDYLDANPESDELPEIAFPFEVKLADGTTQTISSEEELDSLIENCD